MKLFLPEVGNSLTLLNDWTFGLFFEYRNDSLYTKVVDSMFPLSPDEQLRERHYSEKDKNIIFSVWPKDYNDYYVKKRDITVFDFKNNTIIQKNELTGILFTLPKGTVLKIERIYIRRGKKDYSSLTFNISETTHPFLVSGKKNKKKGQMRFWATLNDVNNIDCEVSE
jgi:hypothetical protein